MAGGVDDVYFFTVVGDGGIFGVDSDSAFFFLVIAVHGSFFDTFVNIEVVAGFQESIYEGSFSVIYVGDDCDIVSFHILIKFLLADPNEIVLKKQTFSLEFVHEKFYEIFFPR